MLEQFAVQSGEGEQIYADLRYNATGHAKPVLLFLHGFKAYKDWGPFPFMMGWLAERGYVTIAANFSHNGVGNGTTFTALDRFARNTPSREIQEALELSDYIALGRALPIPEVEIDRTRLGLMGHSRGAGVGIIVGSRSSYVRAVAALSPVGTFDRYSERMKRQWRETGWIQMRHQRTGGIMPVARDLLDDLELHANTLDIYHAAATYPRNEKPLLLVCGTEDLTTPLRESEAIAHAAAGELTTIHRIPKTGHTFGSEEDFTSPSVAIMDVLQLTERFFHEHLVAALRAH